MNKYNDHLEKILTAVFGAIGTIAIFINLHLKGYESENILDAIKDIASLVVVVSVFLIASKIFDPFRRVKGLYNKVEQKITSWAEDNKYLISLDTKSTYNGKVYEIICDLAKFGEEEANQSKHLKGAFLYFPVKESFEKEKTFQIKINKSLFKSKYGDDYEKYQDFLLVNISDKIKYIFKDIKIQTKLSEKEKIDIIFKDMEITDDNIDRLIAIIEFTKTMLLAIA